MKILKISGFYQDSTKFILRIVKNNVMKKIFSICLSLISLQIIAQSKTISGVPAYYWNNGCGPTAMGMIAGYYDTHSFPDLMPGDASTQTPAVDQIIASDQHYIEYAEPLDDEVSGLLSDKSELPESDRHPNNCIADYMGTSQSSKLNLYGWSLPGDIKPAWENYILNQAPNYAGTGYAYSFSSFPWDSLVNNINRNHPLIFLVDYTGDGVYDHFVTVIGYRINGGIQEYRCWDTWDSGVHWYQFRPMSSSYPWGILNCYTFEIHYKLPAAAGNISGPATVCQGQSSVTYTVPEIAYATSYIWTLSTGVTGSSLTNSIIVDFGAGATSESISVKGHNDYGDGSPSTLAITVNSLPSAAGTISGTTTVCQGQSSVAYSVPVIANATTYIWTLPAGATGTSTTNSITVNYGASAVSGNITVKGNNSCGDGTISTLAITVNSLPSAAGTISGTTTVCQGQSSVTYTIPIIANATSYVWSLPTGASGTSTTNSITVNYSVSALSGNITVMGNNSCGNGTSSTLTITVNPLPATPIITLNDNVLHSNATIGNQWYNQSGLMAGAINQDYTVTKEDNYYVIVTLNGCASDISNIIYVVLTGIELSEKNMPIKVYPNPVTNELTIEKAGNTENKKFEIINSSGRVVFSGTLLEKTVVQTSGFSSGVYIIKLENANTFDFKKIIKK